MIAPEPYLSTYLKIVHRVIVYSRSIAYEMHNSLSKRLNKKNAEQLADLQDAIHVIVELLNEWERCDEPAMKENFLEAYDRKWYSEGKKGISLIKIYNSEIESKQKKKKILN